MDHGGPIARKTSELKELRERERKIVLFGACSLVGGFTIIICWVYSPAPTTVHAAVMKIENDIGARTVYRLLQ
jgi:coenzyme F420-reducing hydrogenase gamma subunit